MTEASHSEPAPSRAATAPIREARLQAITGYCGSVADIATKAASGCWARNRERTFNQASACSSGCAHTVLTNIRNAVIINHGPVGCISDSLYSDVVLHWFQYLWQEPYTNVKVFSTDLGENETVFGGAEALRTTIREAYRRHHPDVIFVSSCCTSGIIGEDLTGIIATLADEVPIPIAPVFCDGFRTKVWASGFDAAYHAVLTHLVKPPIEKHPERVNVINFYGRDRKYVEHLLGRLGLVPQFLLAFNTVEEIAKISEAGATVSICQTLGSYLAQGLEEQYGVPQVRSVPPHGISAADTWLRELARVTGTEDNVEALIRDEHERIAPALESLRARLRGKRAYVGMGPGFALSFVNVLQELGLEIVGVTSWHLDQRHDHGQCPPALADLAARNQDFPYSVNDQQSYELLRVLREIAPDIYITRHGGTAAWAAKSGIPSVMVADEYTAFAYSGILSFGTRLVDALSSRRFAARLAQYWKLPYTRWWLEEKNAYQFLTQESR